MLVLTGPAPSGMTCGNVLPVQPPEPPRVHTRPPKRKPDRAAIDQIIAKYQSGVSTNQLMTEHHLAKRTISARLRARGVDFPIAKV